MNSKKMMLVGAIVLIIIVGFGAIFFFLAPQEKEDKPAKGNRENPGNPKSSSISEKSGNKSSIPSSKSKKSGEYGTQIVASRNISNGSKVETGGKAKPPALTGIPHMGTGIKTGDEAVRKGGKPGNTMVAIAPPKLVAQNPPSITDGEGMADGRPPAGPITAPPAASTGAEADDSGKSNRGKVILIFNLRPGEIYENEKLIYSKGKAVSPGNLEIEDNGKKITVSRVPGSYSYKFTLWDFPEMEKNLKFEKGKTENIEVNFTK